MWGCAGDLCRHSTCADSDGIADNHVAPSLLDYPRQPGYPRKMPKRQRSAYSSNERFAAVHPLLVRDDDRLQAKLREPIVERTARG